jgi:pimeloyl-ACP methyl ester carboxylesterase
MSEPSTSQSTKRRVAVDGAELEVEVRGTGEPVVLIQTALVANEFLPLASQPALADHYRVIRYHRRGYAHSSPVQGAGSIPRDAADVRALLAALGVARAHIVGVSYSGAVALQLAADAPSWVHSLALLEPPPVHVPSAAQFVTATTQLLEDSHAHGPAVALDRFLTRVIGPDWRAVIERTLPGAADQMQQDTGTFFDTDIPALLAWRFGAEDARRITQAVLHIGGSESGRWFAEVRDLMLTWLPQAEDVVLAGADHSLALTHPAEVAAALVAFLRRYPIPGGGHRSPRTTTAPPAVPLPRLRVRSQQGREHSTHGPST